MELYLKATAVVLIAVILCQLLGKQEQSFTVLVTLAACSAVLFAAGKALEPILDFVEKLKLMGELDSDAVTIMLKSVGIGLLCEISVLLCSDSGNATLGKTLQIIAVSMILWLSIPLFTKLIDLLTKILGEV